MDSGPQGSMGLGFRGLGASGGFGRLGLLGFLGLFREMFGGLLRVPPISVSRNCSIRGEIFCSLSQHGSSLN